MTLEETLFLIYKLISLAVLFQALEILLIKKYWSDNGIWQWDTLKNDYPKRAQKFFSLFLSEKGFLISQIILIVLINLSIRSSNFTGVILLFLCSLLTSLRWRGTFNGGADTMTMVVLSALTLAMLFPTVLVQTFVLYYVATQLCLSYFIAGIVKIKNPDWRKGKVLSVMLESSNYLVPTSLRKLSSHPTLMLIGSWAIISLELLFPTVFLKPEIIDYIVGISFLFHLANFYVFGFNRFIWAWLAAYPALYFLVSQLKH